MNESKTIDTNSIWSEARTNPGNLNRWLPILIDKSCEEGVIKMIASLSFKDGMILSAYIPSIKACMAFAFEAGRLYGRSELIKELEPKA